MVSIRKNWLKIGKSRGILGLTLGTLVISLVLSPLLVRHNDNQRPEIVSIEAIALESDPNEGLIRSVWGLKGRSMGGETDWGEYIWDVADGLNLIYSTVNSKDNNSFSLVPKLDFIQSLKSPLSAFIMLTGFASGIGLSSLYYLYKINRVNNEKLIEEVRNHQETFSLKQAILESANYAIISVDNQGKIVTFNPAAEEMLGYKASEVVGKTTPGIFHDMEEVKKYGLILSQELGIAIRQGTDVLMIKPELGQIEENIWTYIRKDGSRFPVQLSITAIRDEIGNITGFMGIANDISDRLRTEKVLADIMQELSLHKAALDQSAIVVITNTEGVITYANDQFLQISQYSIEGVIGQTHKLINSGYHSQEFFQQMWSTITSGEIWKGEIKNRARDGCCYWVNSTIVPYLDEIGKPYQYLAIRFDITKRKESELALKESEERFRLMADNSPVLLWMADRVVEPLPKN